MLQKIKGSRLNPFMHMHMISACQPEQKHFLILKRFDSGGQRYKTPHGNIVCLRKFTIKFVLAPF